MKISCVGFGLFLCLVLAGCSGANYSGSGVSNATMTEVSPPPFDFEDGENLRNNMHRLAYELQKLDRSLDAEFDQTASFQASVVETLKNIERIGENLQAGDLKTKHPFLMGGMDSFLKDVRSAQWYASKDHYYMAGRVSGSCVACHRASE